MEGKRFELSSSGWYIIWGIVSVVSFLLFLFVLLFRLKMLIVVYCWQLTVKVKYILELKFCPNLREGSQIYIDCQIYSGHYCYQYFIIYYQLFKIPIFQYRFGSNTNITKYGLPVTMILWICLIQSFPHGSQLIECWIVNTNNTFFSSIDLAKIGFYLSSN